MRPGVRIAVDVGQSRIGVARSDLHGILATPLVTLDATTDTAESISALLELVRDHEVVEIIVGNPLKLDGNPGASAQVAAEYALAIAAAWPHGSVRLVDERLSTVESWRSLHAAGRNTRNSRSVIDQASAVVILQNALDTEQRTGKPAGVVVGEQKGAQ